VNRRYEYIEHTGDLGFKAFGSTREDLFVNAAAALFQALVSAETVEEREERVVAVQAEALDYLLVSWLGELLYLFDTEGLLLRGFEIKDMKEDSLDATVRGEILDPARHEIKTCIKAVTYHQLYIRNANGMWECQVILDL
jgi:SHS2 domain-containing protein